MENSRIFFRHHNHQHHQQHGLCGNMLFGNPTQNQFKKNQFYLDIAVTIKFQSKSCSVREFILKKS